MAYKYKYRISFDYTTVRGNLFTGRKADCCVESNEVLAELTPNNEGLRSCCIQGILEAKPTYKIFSLNITKIEQLTKDGMAKNNN